VISRSGTPESPIEIRAEGTVETTGFDLRADYVTVRGFTIGGMPAGEENVPGIALAGKGLRILNNRIERPAGDGVGCATTPGCDGALIAGNTVRGADGTGIGVAGNSIHIEGNDISGSRRIHATDADGIRFFGTGIVIRGNAVHDISDRGYPEGDEPHTDCFQTFDSHRPPTIDALIEGNTCRNVDHQCLMAEAPVSGRSARILFRNNLCANNGSQGVLVRDIPGVEITGNRFERSIHYTGVVLRQGAVSATIASNSFAAGLQPFEIDGSSQPGVRIEGNRVHLAPKGRSSS
jgi:hypothetical protein